MGIEFNTAGKYLIKDKTPTSLSTELVNYTFVSSDIKSDIPGLSLIILNQSIKVKHLLILAISYWTVVGSKLKIGQAGSFELILTFFSTGEALLAQERLIRIINGEVVS